MSGLADVLLGERGLAFVDLETTGTNTDEDRIVEIGGTSTGRPTRAPWR